MSRPRLGGLVEALLTVAASGLVGATGLAFAAHWWWWAELATHFRVQYLVASALLTVVAVATRHRRVALLSGVCGLASLVPILTVTLRARPPGIPPGFRLLTVNVHTPARAYARVAELIRVADADVVLLMEVDEAWLVALSGSFEGYPVQVRAPRPDNFGIALFSRLPCAGCRVEHFGSDVPSVIGDLRAGGSQLRFVGTHPVPPVSAAGAAAHHAQLRAIAARMGTGPRVLAGDLNATPWSPSFRRFERESGMVRRGGPPRWTWPVGALPLALELDHVLVSRDLTIERRRGQEVGSDHYPLIADISSVVDSTRSPAESTAVQPFPDPVHPR